MTEKSQISIRVFVALVATYSTLMILVFASAIPEFIADQKGFQIAGVPHVLRITSQLIPLQLFRWSELFPVVLVPSIFWFCYRALEPHKLGALSVMLAVNVLFLTALLTLGGSIALLYGSVCCEPSEPTLVTYLFNAGLYSAFYGALVRFEIRAWRARQIASQPKGKVE